MLTAGARLGPYEVTGSLGRGGMGEVHRAKDTRLGREVALKVLPDEVAADPDRLARLEREARFLASFNHPHIASIYGLEESAGVRALVMELVEGETLADRLVRGPLPLAETLPIGRQVAEALEYAHERGVIHRDLKPANVKLTADGSVKLLDFGLAKAWEGETTAEGGRADTESPTLSRRATRAGVILGTAAYMSPEQARGKPVDKRTDVWAFGVVLLEMLTGRPVFAGETVTDVLAAVISHEPDLGALPAGTPPEVRRLLRRCLEKDPKRRLRDVGEARIVLETPGPVPGEAPSGPTPERGRRGRRWRWVAAGLGLAALAATSSFLAGRSSAPNPIEDLRSLRLTFRRGSVVGARFAPDAQTVIYGAAWDGQPLDIYSVRTDVRESRTLGVPGAAVLAVSSTGELAVSLDRRTTLGFEGTGTLARMPLGAAAPRELLENVQDADWSPDGQSLAVVREVGGRRRLEYPIGTVLHETGGWLSHPRVSPDGRTVAFVDHPNRGDNRGALAVVDAGGEVRVLADQAPNGVAWAPSGEEIFYANGGTLAAVRLAGRSRVVYRELTTFELLDVSERGSVLLSRTTYKREMVGRTPGEPGERNLSWLDWSFPSTLSDDGSTVVFEEQNFVSGEGDYALFMRPTDGSAPVRLGSGRAFALSPDGRWVLTVQGTGADNELVLLPTGVGESRRLGPLGLVPIAGAFLPGGDRVVLSAHGPGEGNRLYVRELSGGTARAFSPEGVTAYFCRLLSPDGREAFATAPDGRLTLYPVDGEGDPRVVPGTSLDDIPIRWTGDGRGIYVQSATVLPALVEQVDVATGERRPLVELTPPDPSGVLVIGPVHLSADGKAYVYSYRRVLDELYVVEGLR
jgi:serine/threonine protein kinase/dipeptidyl aminopeptidase/acylaminoacyl peptidase